MLVDQLGLCAGGGDAGRGGDEGRHRDGLRLVRERVGCVQQYTSRHNRFESCETAGEARPAADRPVTRGGRRVAALALVLTALSNGACDSGFIQDTFIGQTPHERYALGLRSANLAETGIGSDWFAAAERSLEDAVRITTPFEEVGFLDPTEPRAVGYRLSLRRGQHLTAEIELENGEPQLIFLDLFVLGTNASQPRLLTSADSGSHEIEFTARRDGQYVLRMQPELLRGGRYSLRVAVTGSLAFPVDDHGTDAILSVFGDPRDGGRRRHHGVDIFAPRGTPVVAVANGVISRVDTTRVGGLIVWQRDSIGHSFYYAHLDSHVATEGVVARRGVTLGFVGNSGNARTTPPHLHFGIYSRGPKDPIPYIERLPWTPREFVGEVALLGGWARARRAGTRIRESATVRAPVLTEVDLHTPMRVVGGTGSWYRVYLPDGTTGFVSATVTEPVDEAIRTLAEGGLVLRNPTLAAAAVDSLVPGEQVPVLGVFGEFAFVQSAKGFSGWVHLD